MSLQRGMLSSLVAISLAAPEEGSLLQAQKSNLRGYLNSSRANAAKNFVIRNNCEKPVFVRKGPLDDQDDCPSGGCTPEQTIQPGESKSWSEYVPSAPHNSIVLSWADYSNHCVSATFCTQLELNTDWHLNFAHQRGFSMNVGVAFYNGGYPDGQIPGHCPTSAFNPPSWPADSLKSSAGQMDTCKWDVKNDCPESAFLVATSQEAVASGGPFYCVSPDQNLAVISELVDNPTEEECALPAPPPAVAGIGTNPPLCERRFDIANNMGLIPPLQLWDATGNELTTGDITEPADKKKAGGAKDYQHAVDKGCMNQPPTQRVEWADATHTQLKLNQGPQDQGGIIPEGSTEKYLDHGVSYEGDDVHFYRVDGQVAYFTRDTGIICPPEDFDTVVLEACPA